MSVEMNNDPAKVTELIIERLKASVTMGILTNIFNDISAYSPGAHIPPTQQKWWLNFIINGHSFKEIAEDIRYRVICIWHIHPDRPEGYNIRWSRLNEIEIECVQ